MAMEGTWTRSSLSISHCIGECVLTPRRSFMLISFVVPDFICVISAIWRSHHRNQDIYTFILQEGLLHSPISQMDIQHWFPCSGVAVGKQLGLRFPVHSCAKSLGARITWKMRKPFNHSPSCTVLQRHSRCRCVDTAGICRPSSSAVNSEEDQRVSGLPFWWPVSSGQVFINLPISLLQSFVAYESRNSSLVIAIVRLSILFTEHLNDITCKSPNYVSIS